MILYCVVFVTLLFHFIIIKSFCNVMLNVLYLLEPDCYACDFEQDFCNWLPGNNKNAFNWTRIKAVSPNTDHTTGKDLQRALAFDPVATIAVNYMCPFILF